MKEYCGALIQNFPYAMAVLENTEVVKLNNQPISIAANNANNMKFEFEKLFNEQLHPQLAIIKVADICKCQLTTKEALNLFLDENLGE